MGKAGARSGSGGTASGPAKANQPLAVSFRGRLTLFLGLIVVISMVAVALLGVGHERLAEREGRLERRRGGPAGTIAGGS